MIKIIHNTRCSKSREALALLEEHQEDIVVIDYIKNPLDANELKHIVSLLNIPARALLRTKEDEYKALGLDNVNLSEDDIISAMVTTPKLIERPIVIKGNKAVIGRPTTNVLTLLS